MKLDNLAIKSPEGTAFKWTVLTYAGLMWAERSAAHALEYQKSEESYSLTNFNENSQPSNNLDGFGQIM